MIKIIKKLEQAVLESAPLLEKVELKERHTKYLGDRCNFKMKLIKKENGDYHLVINGEIKSLQEFNITKEDCDILTLGYSVEKMAEEWFLINQYNQEDMIHSHRVAEYITAKNLWKEGFKAHQELVKDKLFTVEDIINALKLYKIHLDVDKTSKHKWIQEPKEFVQSLLPKTEWDCCISDGKLVIIN